MEEWKRSRATLNAPAEREAGDNDGVRTLNVPAERELGEDDGVCISIYIYVYMEEWKRNSPTQNAPAEREVGDDDGVDIRTYTWEQLCLC